MMLKAILFAMLAQAVLAQLNSQEHTFGKCLNDQDKMVVIHGKAAELESALAEISNQDFENILRMIWSKTVNDHLLNKMCSTATHVTSVINELTSVVATCYEPALQSAYSEGVKSVKGILDGTVAYACDHNAENFTRFMNENGFSCIESKVDKIKTECFSFMSTVRTTSVYPPTLALLQQNIPHEVHRCVARALKECPSSVPAQMFDDWYKKIRSYIPTASESGPKSSSNIVASMSNNK